MAVGIIAHRHLLISFNFQYNDVKSESFHDVIYQMKLVPSKQSSGAEGQHTLRVTLLRTWRALSAQLIKMPWSSFIIGDRG